MQFFYDGQIRRYLLQTIRVFSNFVVKYGDGTLHQIPVLYGDPDRQVANILRQNSENITNSVPRIAVHIKDLQLDSSRLSDATYVGKMHFREREIIDGVPDQYGHGQGRNYTVERLMPTPYKLSMDVDIWASSTEQKLQIMEQLLVLFNPSLELQTSDNYIDWTSLSVLTLTNLRWSSRSVPVGNDSPIDIATLTVEAPVWISPPVKVKHLGVITKIYTGLHGGWSENTVGYVEGLGVDTATPEVAFNDLLSLDITTVSTFKISVYNNQAILLKNYENTEPDEPTLEITIPVGPKADWISFFDQFPGKYKAGSSQIFLLQKDGTEIVGTIAVNSTDYTLLMINWDLDTLKTNTGIDSAGVFDYQPGYNISGSYRPNSTGTFDAIVNPQTYNPHEHTIVTGTRFLIIEDIGSVNNPPGEGPAGWQGTDGVDLIAKTNDIIEWTGLHWHVIFASAQNTDNMVWQTNIYTGVQYLWNGVQWMKSFEGNYGPGQWRLKL